MDLCDAYQKWRHVYWRMRRGGLLAFLVVSVVMVTACQGNGELGEPDSKLSGEAGEAASELSGEAGEAASELPGQAGEATKEPAGDPGATVDRIVFVSATGELFTIKPDGSDLKGPGRGSPPRWYCRVGPGPGPRRDQLLHVANLVAERLQDSGLARASIG